MVARQQVVRRRRWVRGAVAVAVIALLAIAVAVARRTRGAIAFPPPPAPGQDTGPAFDDFVGSETCGQCHHAQYQTWLASTHGRAGGVLSNGRGPVIAPFNGRPLHFRDAVVTPSVTAGGQYIVTVAQQDRPARVFQVDAVVGGGFMEGGGTQAFFSKFPDGTLRFLPFDYSRTDRTYFCNTLGRADHGWVPISPDMSLADCGDWPPRRVLGSTERFQSCQQCHGSQILVTVDTSTRRHETRLTTLAINCESCHGPGKRHVELARSARIDTAEDIGMRSLATLTKDQSLEVCFQCHAAKTALEPGYLPGKPLPEHFALKLPLLLDTIYHADGRTRSFAYQEGHLASDCYLNGSMTCVDCHDPHSQRYRDVNGSPLVGRFDDGQCLGCHPSKADPLERHTHHPAASAGSRCVSCHMPYLQQPNVGGRIRYARSDHAIPIPRPAFDSRLGVESACRQCHQDQAVEALDARVTAWYGELKPHPAAVSAAIAARGTSDPAVAARAFLSAVSNDGESPPSPFRERGTGGEAPRRTGGAHPWAEFVGLTEVLERYARPDMVELDGETIEGLQRLAARADPDLQALALATLHLVHGSHGRVRRFLARQLGALGDRDEIVRSRWVWVLRVRGDSYLARGEHESALAAYHKALELAPGDPTVLRGLGVVHTRLRDYPTAIEHFRRSLAAAPDDPQVLIGLGFALMQQGDLDGAMAAHRRAIAVSPWDPGGYANLAVVLLRRGAVEPALDTLRQALALDPGLAEGYFLLARAHAALGRPDEAAADLRRGLEFDPRNAAALRMLESLSHR